MIEYVSDAVILAHEPRAELDLRISFFTKRFGKLIAKAKSVRKITSKLAGHLDIGNVAQIRIVEKNGLQVVDSLKQEKLNISPQDLRLLSALLHEGEADMRLWAELTRGGLDWYVVLGILGWDPEHALCRLCGAREPVYFEVSGQEFLCASCVVSSPLTQQRVFLLDVNPDRNSP